MKKQAFTGILILFMGFYATTNAQVIKKTISINNRFSTTKTFQDSMRLKKFAPNTVGSLIQQNQIEFDKLTKEEKEALQAMSIKKLPIYKFRINRPWTDVINHILHPENFSTVKINNFGTLHPCGIAISKLGKFAITTFEGNEKDGSLLIWNSYDDFNKGKTAYKEYTLPDPEAVVFDNNEGLYVSSTYDGKIYYLRSITDNPNPTYMVPIKSPISYFIDATGNSNSAQNWNPRGLAVNANNELLVMCENLQRPNLKSRIVKIADSNTNNPKRSILSGSDQQNNNAIGVFINGNTLYTTDLNDGDGFVRKYNYNLNTNSVTPITNLPGAGATLDLISDGNFVYFTNVTGGAGDMIQKMDENCKPIIVNGQPVMIQAPHSYIVKWDTTNGNTTNIDMGRLKACDAITTSWALAIYGTDLIIADALHNNVKIVNKNSF
jgi:hypothetical protein